MPDEGLRQYFLTTFTLLYHQNKDPRIFDEMIPWERDILLNLMAKEVEEENLKLQLEAINKKNQGKKPARVKRK